MTTLLGKKITRKRVARYMLTPGFAPRISELGRSFGHFAHIIALIFAQAGIFPRNHPYINPANIGRFGFGNVIGEGLRNISFDRRHLPQTIIYFATIGLVVLIALQFILTLFTMGVGGASAAAPSFQCVAPCDPTRDLALELMANIFGTYNFFQGIAGPGPGPVHVGLYTLLAVYSNALLVLATIIVLYYIISAVGETAVFGTAFGRRWNTVWAPIRLVAAIGLLVPLPMAENGGNLGLNSGQWIVLFAAKSGSNLASNSFNIYAQAVSDPAYAQDYVAPPRMAELMPIVESTWTWALCGTAIMGTTISDTEDMVDNNWGMPHFWVKSKNPGDDGWNDLGTAFPTGNQVINWYDAQFQAEKIGDIVLAYGPEARPDYCGVVTMPQNFMADKLDGEDLVSGRVEAQKYEYPRLIRETYIDAMRDLWQNGAPPMIDNPGLSPLNTGNAASDFTCVSLAQGCLPGNFGDRTLIDVPAYATAKDDWLQQVKGFVDPRFNGGAADALRIAYAQRNRIDMLNGVGPTPSALSRGWAAAALWYNEIMKANMILQESAGNVPRMSDKPMPLEYYETVAPDLSESLFSGAIQQESGTNAELSTAGMEFGRGSGNIMNSIKKFFGFANVAENTTERTSPFDYEVGRPIGVGLEWFRKQPSEESRWDPPKSDLGIWKVLQVIFGLQGFVDLTTNNPMQINPLVVMQNTGSGLITRALWGFLIAAIAGIFTASLGNALFTIAGLGFGIGLFLAYVLPMLPFIYFFFGVVQWGFSVFEGVVAAPLWALSHLRIDGEGLPGPAAMNGYFLIFELFLRPILLIFGLVASMLCFTASAYLLHQTFSVATETLRGDVSVSVLDGLVTVFIYALLTYMLANSTFKLITMIPQGILRWMGQGAATPLSDMFGDVAGQMQQHGGMMAGGLMAGARSSASAGSTLGCAGASESAERPACV